MISDILFAKIPQKEKSRKAYLRQSSIKQQIGKGQRNFLSASLAEKSKAQKVGRELIFSADLWYNGANEKPLPTGEVAAQPTERATCCNDYPLTRYRGSSPKGRAFGCARSSLGVWALPDTFCNTKAKLAIKQALKGGVICQKSIFSNTTVQKNLF